MTTRVLWLTTGLGRGGVEQLLVGAARRIDRARFDVEVAYVLPWKHALVDDLRAAGVPARCVGIGRPPLDPRWLVRLARLLRDGEWDVVHTHAPLPAAAARLLAPKHVAFVHTEHNVWARYRPWTRWLNRLTWRRNRHVLAVSDGVAASIEPRRSVANPPVEVVVQGIDQSTVHRGEAARTEARRRLGIADDALVVGTVGNLVPKKDHRTLLAAVDLVAAAGTPLTLVVVGTGPLDAELEALGARNRATVILTGIRDDVPWLLPGFDVFTLSSRFEGLPIALIEAMAAGVACAVTAVGGVPEVVTDGVEGLLVPPGNPAALAAALGTLLGDPARRAGCAAAAAASASRYSLDAAVGRTQAIYDAVAGGVAC